MILQDNNTPSTISDLKVKAKDQLLGNYQIATGSFALLFVLFYAVAMVISSALAAGVSDDMSDRAYIILLIENKLITFVLAAFLSILITGFTYILRKIADGEGAGIADLFFVFKNHPDKVIILSFIFTAVQTILLLPSTVASHTMTVTASADTPLDFDGKKFLMWVLLYVAGMILYMIFALYFAFAYQVYLDDTDESVGGILKKSFWTMKGNVLRYFYLHLTFIGYWMLVILSFGIAVLWVSPYETMSAIQFYYDLRDRNYERGI